MDPVSVGGAVVGAAGFTAAGVAKGSVAAAAQSMIGNVAVGSTFAGLQSVAALGATGPVGVAVMVGGGLTAAACKLFFC